MVEHGVERALVIGDGGWGTTLAILLARNGIPVTLWANFPDQARELAQLRENKRFLPGVMIPPEVVISADPSSAANGADFVVSAVPTQYLRGIAERFEDALPGDVPVVSATKGIEIETFKTPSQILEEVLGARPIASPTARLRE
jgi:glycerol-3-phosphate dehydrogenase (NAD(P)+)